MGDCNAGSGVCSGDGKTALIYDIDRHSYMVMREIWPGSVAAPVFPLTRKFPRFKLNPELALVIVFGLFLAKIEGNFRSCSVVPILFCHGNYNNWLFRYRN